MIVVKMSQITMQKNSKGVPIISYFTYIYIYINSYAHRLK